MKLRKKGLMINMSEHRKPLFWQRQCKEYGKIQVQELV